MNGKTVIKAYIETQKPLDLESLRAYCLSRLANYKLPGEYIIVESLPKNMIGKVRYNLIE